MLKVRNIISTAVITRVGKFGPRSKRHRPNQNLHIGNRSIQYPTIVNLAEEVSARRELGAMYVLSNIVSMLYKRWLLLHWHSDPTSVITCSILVLKRAFFSSELENHSIFNFVSQATCDSEHLITQSKMLSFLPAMALFGLTVAMPAPVGTMTTFDNFTLTARDTDAAAFTFHWRECASLGLPPQTLS